MAAADAASAAAHIRSPVEFMSTAEPRPSRMTQMGAWLLLVDGEVTEIASALVPLHVTMRMSQGSWHDRSAADLPGLRFHAVGPRARGRRCAERCFSVWWPVGRSAEGRTDGLLRRAGMNLPGDSACSAVLQPAAAALEAAVAADDPDEAAALLSIAALCIASIGPAAANLCCAEQLQLRVREFGPRCLPTPSDAPPPQDEDDLAKAVAGAPRSRHRVLHSDDFPVLLHFPIACIALRAAGAEPPYPPEQLRQITEVESARRCRVLRALGLEQPDGSVCERAVRAALAGYSASCLERPAPPVIARALAQAAAGKRPAEACVDQHEDPPTRDEAAFIEYLSAASPCASRPQFRVSAVLDDLRIAEPHGTGPSPPVELPVLEGTDAVAAAAPHIRALLPAGLGYFDGVVTEEEERELMRLATTSGWGESRHDKPMMRRVQHFGFEFLYPSGGMDIAHPLPGGLPPWAAEIGRRVERAAGIPEGALTQLTVNEYTPGQGISPHVDCLNTIGSPLMTLSLGSALPMAFAHPVTGRRQEVLLRRRSLCVMSGPARCQWTHSIPKRTTDPSADGAGAQRRAGARVSLTFRVVPPMKG